MAQYTAISIRSKGESRATTLVMPVVKSISRTTQASLTEISTMVYGYRNNFCMDLGTKRSFSIKFERVNPFPYDDSSDDYADSEKWSNGKWYRMLEKLLDRWQNLCVDPSNPSELAGGFRFLHIPEDETLYPRIDGNVFMVGNLNMSYKATQMMEFTLPLTLSRMTGSTKPVEQVTLTLVTEDIVDKTTQTDTVKVPKGYETSVPRCPDGWTKYQPGRIFQYWTDSDGNRLNEGEMHIWNADATLTAVWKGALAVNVYSLQGNQQALDLISRTDAWGSSMKASDDTSVVPDGATRAIAYLVGAGGGAGGGYVQSTGIETIGKRWWRPGGGGGAGQFVKTDEISVTPGAPIEVWLGVPGSGGTNISNTNGGNGGPTYIKYNGSDWTGGVTRAEGGKGGKSMSNGGAGGAEYWSGGSYDEGSMNGADGSTGGENTTDNAGKGGTGSEYTEGKVDYYRYGGCGGGATDFKYRFYTETQGWMPGPDSDYFYRSRGGNGQSYTPGTGESTPAMDGYLGGGGGSGWKKGNAVSRSGIGGFGIAIVIFYEG